MPCPFTGPKMFCADPNFLSQPKNLTAFSASSKTFVLTQKPILLNANHLFVWHKMFGTVTICKYILVRHKKFGSAQNILRPVKGQGISERFKIIMIKIAKKVNRFSKESFYLRQQVPTK